MLLLILRLYLKYQTERLCFVQWLFMIKYNRKFLREES